MTYPPVAIRADFDDNTAAVTVHAAHHNDLADGLNDVTTELGTNPKGTYENVDDRLTAHEAVTDNALTASIFGDAGEMIVSNGPQSADTLGPGSQYEILTIDAGVPVWAQWTGIGTAGPGLVELATTAETKTGTDATRAVTPAGGAATYQRALYIDSTDRASTSTGGTEDDLASFTVAAGQLATNGDTIRVTVGGTWVGHATATRRVRIYFGGTAVLDTTAYSSTAGGSFTATATITRVSSSVVRVSTLGGFPSYTAISALPLTGVNYVEVTGLTLANTQIIKTTGVAAGAGAAASDIVNKTMTVDYTPAP